MADKPKSSSDNFIAKIVKDPKQVPDTLLLSGYLGTSSEDKYTRLYFDAQLSNFADIPNDACLHTQDYPDDPLGRSYVWIKKDAILIHGRAGTKAKFLEGPIVNEYANVAGVAQGTGTTNNSIFYCNETYQDFVCGTTKRGLLCTIVQQPTLEQWCVTQHRPYCTPVTPRCPTYSDGPAVCPTKICEVQGIAQQQAQPMGFTFPLQNCNTVPYPLCNPTFHSPYCHTLVGPRCITYNSPLCNYTISGAICPTHTPGCYPSVKQYCFTHNSPFCNIKTASDPICHEALTVIDCPQQTVFCPSVGACPSIACGYGGGFAGNPGY
jgi:hypothetical protein